MALPLEVKSLSKTFPGSSPVEALHNISFYVSQGEILAVLGPNGAGKTTLIRVLTSLLSTTSGEISYWGEDLDKNRSSILNRIGFASTYTSLPLFLTVEENLLAHASLFSIPWSSARTRAKALLKKFGVPHLESMRFSRLSAGERTRVMLAKAFLPNPEIVFLDEPTASLDPDIAITVRTFLAEQRSSEGTTIIFSSHNMTEVSEISDRVIALQKGKLIATGTARALAKNHGLATISWSGSGSLPAYTSQIPRDYQSSLRCERGRFSVMVSSDRVNETLQLLLSANTDSVNDLQVSPPELEQFFLSIARG